MMAEEWLRLEAVWRRMWLWQRVRLVGLALLVVVLGSCWLAWGDSATHGLPDQTRQRQVWHGDSVGGGFVASGCLPSVPGGLIFGAFACEAYVKDTTTDELLYVSQGAATVTLAAVDGTHWLGVCRDTHSTVTGWTRRDGTHYVHRQTGSEVATPSGCEVIGKVTVAGSVVTVVEDRRRPASYARTGLYDPKDPLYGALGDGTTNDTVALTAWLAAIPAFQAGFLPTGVFLTDPLTITRDGVRLVGRHPFSNSNGSILKARGNQTHVLKWQSTTDTRAGSALAVGTGMDKITIDGGGNTISTGCLILSNSGRHGNFHQVYVVNCKGRALYLRDIEDVYFTELFITACGLNSGTYCLEADNTGTDTVNSIWFTNARFESARWGFIKVSGALHNNWNFNHVKFEGRDDIGEGVLADLTFKWIDISGVAQFLMHDCGFAGTNFMTGDTISIVDSDVPQLTGLTVYNPSAAQTGNFIRIFGMTGGYQINRISGYNMGTFDNDATRPGDWFTEPLTPSGIRTVRHNDLSPVMFLPDRMQMNPATDPIAFGIAGSLTGRSLSFASNDNSIPAVLVPTGYPRDVRVNFRVQPGSGTPTLTFAYRDKALAQTSISSVTLVAGWQNIAVLVTSGMLSTAETVVLFKTAGADSVLVDAAWIEYDPVDENNSGATFTSAGGTTGKVFKGAEFVAYCTTSALGGTVSILADGVLNAINIVSQHGTAFVVGAPGADQVGLTLSAADANGRRAIVFTANGASTETVFFRQIAAY